MRKRTITVLILIMGTVALVAFAHAFDHAPYDAILKAHVDEEGLIDYHGIARDERFSDYIESLETAHIEALSRDGRLAFWVNAYNAITIDKVIQWKPKKSVRETFVPGVWTSTKFFETREHTVAGQRVSPDDIEHAILRKKFDDPRIHFALVCASRGCPPIPRGAYTGENVQTMLEAETRKYLNSERGVRIDRAENTIDLSKIFDWFESDFVEESGSVLSFIRPYLDEEKAEFLDRKPNIAYIDYDWALNAQGPWK